MLLALRLQQYLLQKLRKNYCQAQQKGFTLIELLVVVLMGSIVLVALLGFMVELIQTDGTETAKTETQREMQLALNYMMADLREAVYVYDGRCNTQATASCPSYLGYTNDGSTAGSSSYLSDSTTATSIINNPNTRFSLAFWKADELSQTDEDEVNKITACTNPTTNTGVATASSAYVAQNVCNNIRLARQQLSLIVYMQVPNTVSNDNNIWQGQSRIVRYRLPKYDCVTASSRRCGTETGSATAPHIDITSGYVDPYIAGVNIFTTWPWQGTTNEQTAIWNTTRPNISPVTLVDFVAAPSGDVDDDSNIELAPITCPTGYATTPRHASSGNASSTGFSGENLNVSRSFVACVRDTLNASGGTGTTTGLIQDVILYLRGNAAGRNNDLITSGVLPTLEGRVTLRGTVERN
jgi:prepilin-type N-terminal cleavage/methylation domain-containing protein